MFYADSKPPTDCRRQDQDLTWWGKYFPATWRSGDLCQPTATLNFQSTKEKSCGTSQHRAPPQTAQSAGSSNLQWRARHKGECLKQALFLSKKENVHLFSSSLPRLDKCHETSRIFLRTEQTFASCQEFWCHFLSFIFSGKWPFWLWEGALSLSKSPNY